MISTSARIFSLWIAFLAEVVTLVEGYSHGTHDQFGIGSLAVYGFVLGVIASIPRKVKYKALQPVYIGAREEVTETDIEINS